MSELSEQKELQDYTKDDSDVVTIVSRSAYSSVGLPPVLDVCCGSRMFWFDKCDGRGLYMDKRRGEWAADRGTPGTKGRKPIVVNPDILADFTSIPFPDESFWHVVFDPPHLRHIGTTGILAAKYGRLVGDWECELREGFRECFRVLKPNGTLIFKWSSREVPLARVVALSPVPPLYGHTTKPTTHWIAFIKAASQPL